VRWATAYGVPKSDYESLGVRRPDMPGAEPTIAPTLYLVDPDGKVLWSDEAGRFQHKDTEANLAELSKEMDKDLARTGP
jgi:hypothetical protein